MLNTYDGDNSEFDERVRYSSESQIKIERIRDQYIDWKYEDFLQFGVCLFVCLLIKEHI